MKVGGVGCCQDVCGGLPSHLYWGLLGWWRREATSTNAVVGHDLLEGRDVLAMDES